MLAHFSNFILLHYLYLDSQWNGQPKFQLYKPRTFKDTVLQSGNNWKIDLYGDNMENKLQVLN